MLSLGTFVIVIILLFHFSGALSDEPSGTGYVLSALGLTNPKDFGGSSFWITIIGIGSLSITGIIIGVYITRSLETTLFFGAGIILFPVFIALGQDLVLIANQLWDLNHMLAVMIISPLVYAYGLTVYDWCRGRD